MDPIAPPKAAPDLKLAQRPAPEAPNPVADAAAQSLEAHKEAMRAQIAPAKLDVKLDEDAGRFVQTLSDSNTDEMLRRYPSEAQLAYSRAVMAYLRALAR